MSFMRGDLLTKTRKLVKGLAKATPKWLKAMEESQLQLQKLAYGRSRNPEPEKSHPAEACLLQKHIGPKLMAPPVTFPRTDGKFEKIILPEDIYVKKFFQKHPDSKYEDAIRFAGFDPPPARVFGWRVLELKEQGVSEEEAMAVADMEYRSEKKAKKTAYKRLKQIARLQGKKPPPNPYPSAIKEIQDEEKKYVYERFHNPKMREIVQKMKEDKAAEMQDRWRGSSW